MALPFNAEPGLFPRPERIALPALELAETIL
jgi:hypothetical protein